jgi:alkylation response protein AidB-like acyl-CoA dehydrogenase
MIEDVVAFLRSEIKPRAEVIDRDTHALRTALNDFARHDWMALKRPTEYGGPAMPEPDFRRFQQECARASGTFAFLQTQHQSAVSMLAKSDNSDLKQDWIPKMGNGERYLGIGFSQLRRPGTPMVRATAEGDGYRISGHVPWVTGFGYYGHFLLGANLPSGEALFAIVPLEASEGALVSEPMRLSAMETAQTVTVTYDNFFLPKDQVAFIRPAGWIQNNDLINISLQAHFAMGNALAGLDVLEERFQERNQPFVKDAREALLREWNAVNTALAETPVSSDEQTSAERLRLRAWAIELMGRCAHAAITASSGASNSINHRAQRIWREALVFTVSAQTSAIMQATLQRLIRPV